MADNAGRSVCELHKFAFWEVHIKRFRFGTNQFRFSPVIRLSRA